MKTAKDNSKADCTLEQENELQAIYIARLEVTLERAMKIIRTFETTNNKGKS